MKLAEPVIRITKDGLTKIDDIERTCKSYWSRFEEDFPHIKSEAINEEDKVNLADSRIKCVLRALHERPWQRTTALARTVRLSPDRLRHLFLKEVGVSISAYSLEVRLQRARRLLRNTNQTIKEIRYGVGIPDGSNFTRYFRKRFLITPSAYRTANHFGPRLPDLTSHQ